MGNRKSLFKDGIQNIIWISFLVLNLTLMIGTGNLSAQFTTKIMPVGDSITDGMGGSGNGYRGYLYNKLAEAGYNFAFVGSQGDSPLCHEGHPGWHADYPNIDQYDILGEIYGWLANNPPDIVLLHIGTNDIDNINDSNIEQAAVSIRNEVNAILGQIDQYEKDNNKEITVILARIINRRDCSIDTKCEITTRYNFLLKDLADKRAASGDKIIVADMESAIDDYQNDMHDNLHPNDSGYEKMAREWFHYLAALCSRNPAIYDLVLRAASPDNPHNIPTGDLYCEYSLYSGAMTAATAWCKNGSPIMVLYMPFEGGNVYDIYDKSNTLRDYSGNQNSCDKKGEPSWKPSGGFKESGYFSFDAYDDYIDVGDIMPMGAYTKAAWVKLSSGQNYNNIISGSSGHAFWIYYDGSGYRLGAGHKDPWNIVKDPDIFALGVWTFVAVTYDPYDNGRMVLYKDGNSIDSINNVPAIYNNDRRIFIGSFGDGVGNKFKGSIDDVRIYGHALSPEQIEALYINDPNGIDGRDRIVSQETSDGDLWHAHVIPFSYVSAGQTYESNILGIESSGDIEPPKIKTLNLASNSGNNLSTDDLLCTYDLAGSATGAVTTWYKDGSPLMVLYFPMDGCKANALKDFSGNQNICDKEGEPTWNPTGGFKENGYFSFDGYDDYIDARDIMPMGAYTKAAWVKLDLGNNYNNIVSGASSHAFWIYIDGSGYRLGAGHNGAFKTVKDPGFFTLGVWTFVAVTYDPDDNGRMSLYKNGYLIDSSSNVPGIYNNDRRIFIGSFGNGVGNKFKGSIDDVRIYDHALSPEQIKSLYDSNSLSSRESIVSQETRDCDQWQAHITPFSSSATGQTYKSNILVIGAYGATGPLTIKNKTSSFASSSGKDLPTDDLLCTYDLADSSTPVAVTWYKDGAPLMLLYVPMEGCAACALKDYSGNNNYGEKGQGATWEATSGLDGKGAFRFNGEGDAYINFGNIIPHSFNKARAYTKTAWIKMDSNCVIGNIISGSCGHGFWVCSGQLQAGHEFCQQGKIDVMDPNKLDPNRWYFVAVSYDDLSDSMRLYKNGRLIDEKKGNVDVGGLDLSNDRVLVGAFDDNGNPKSNWKGIIDDVRIYGHVLSEDQIDKIYKEGLRDRNATVSQRIYTIVSQETNEGERWQCKVTPFLATEKCLSFTSNTIAIKYHPDSNVDNRIEQCRMGDANLVIKTSDGYPLQDANITIEQIRHEFLFGWNFGRNQYSLRNISRYKPENLPLLSTDRDMLKYYDQNNLPLKEVDLNLLNKYTRRFLDFANYTLLLDLKLPWKDSEEEYLTVKNYCDNELKWLQDNEIKVITYLFFHFEFGPKWPWIENDPDKTFKTVEKHVKDSIGYYKGKIDYFNVVNEPTNPCRFDTIRQIYNDCNNRSDIVDVVGKLLRAANAIDPKAQLMLNEYYIYPSLVPPKYLPDPNFNFPKLLGDPNLRENGEPLYDIIGLQGHLGGSHPLRYSNDVNRCSLWEICEVYKDFNVPIHFTELNATITSENETEQAIYITNLYRILFSHPSVEAITWFTPSEWLYEGFNFMFLLDSNCDPKPAYHALMYLTKGKKLPEDLDFELRSFLEGLDPWWTSLDSSDPNDSEQLEQLREGRYRFKGYYGDYRIVVRPNSGSQRTFYIKLRKNGSREFELNL